VLPADHPRKASLDVRHRLVNGFRKGLVAEAGLIAHGRGEAFDYLLGEKTTVGAKKSEEAAAALLLLAEKPAISVNGNAAALCAREIAELARAVEAKVEVNLFYRTVEREKRIASELRKAGCGRVYGVGAKPRTVKGLKSSRRLVDEALWRSDVVLVMLEDGDRTESLVGMGKKVIAVDLNPLSRTSRKAHVTVVDNLVRALPNITKYAKKMRKAGRSRLDAVAKGFDNKRNLALMEKLARKGL